MQANDLYETMVMSPCVGKCCLDDNDLCVGCYRHIDEITGWHSADNGQRQVILGRCQARRETQAKDS